MLPPSASDLELLGSSRLCDAEETVVKSWQGLRYEQVPWGSGEQLQRSAQSGQPDHDRFYFFNDEQRLVGAVFRYNEGLSLKPYPVLRQTLSELRPSSTFYIDPTQLLSQEGARSAVLYRTGDYTSTTQYLVLESEGDPTLLVASLAIDPYEQLLSSYHETFLPGLNRSRPRRPGKPHPRRTRAPIFWPFSNSHEGKPRYSGLAELPSRRLPLKPTGDPFNTGSRTRPV